MALKKYAERKHRPSKRRVGPIIGALLLIVLIIGTIELYRPRPAVSSTVYCGVFQYLEFQAKTFVQGTESNVTETMTTAVSYTTSTSPAGTVGHSYSNSTTTVNAAGDQAGVETICKYIPDPSSSSSST